MKVVLLAGLAILAAISAGVFFNQIKRGPTPVPAEIISKYTAWKKEYGKLYATPAENDYRLRIFVVSLLRIEDYNREYEYRLEQRGGQRLTGKMFSQNMFMDIDDLEFDIKYNGDTGGIEGEERETVVDGQVGEVRAVREWIGLGQKEEYEVRVRNQAACGSCWSFAAIANVEKAYFDLKGQRLDFSQQELVDCERLSNGCSGGQASRAMNYTLLNGISLASDYPYKAIEGVCQASEKTRYNMGSGELMLGTYKLRMDSAEQLVNRGYHISISVVGKGMMRYLSNSIDAFDASLTGECHEIKGHAVNLIKSYGNNTFTMLNSWSSRWASGGMKNITACNSTNFWGIGSIISLIHPKNLI